MASGTARSKAAAKPLARAPATMASTASTSASHEVWRKWRHLLTSLCQMTKHSQYAWALMEREIISSRSAILTRMMPTDLAKELAAAIKLRKINPAECNHASFRNYGNVAGSFRHCLDCDSVWKKNKEKGEWAPVVSRTYGGDALKRSSTTRWKASSRASRRPRSRRSRSSCLRRRRWHRRRGRRARRHRALRAAIGSSRTSRKPM